MSTGHTHHREQPFPVFGKLPFLYVRPTGLGFLMWALLSIINPYVQSFYGWTTYGVLALAAVLCEIFVIEHGTRTPMVRLLRVVGFPALGWIIAYFFQGMIQFASFVKSRQDADWFSWPVATLAWGIAFVYEFIEHEDHIPHDPRTRLWIISGLVSIPVIVFF